MPGDGGDLVVEVGYRKRAGPEGAGGASAQEVFGLLAVYLEG